jgi:DNA-binding CsgD family transcriptional regulator
LRRAALHIATAAFERAAVLSEDPAIRASRLMSALNWTTARGDRAEAMRLVSLIDEQHLRGGERARLAWFREGYLGGGWSGTARLATFAAAVDEMHEQGNTELAFDLLQSMTVRIFWTNPDAQTREIVLTTAARLGIDGDDARLISMLAGVAPIERGAEVLERLERLGVRDDLIPPDLFRLGLAATALGAFDKALTLLAPSVDGLRALGALGLVAQAQMSRAWAAAQLGDTWLGLVAATECETLAAEAGHQNYALTAAITRGHVLALRGQTAEARALADMGEAVLLPMGAHPMLAMVQLVRGVAALAEGRHSSAFDELHRIFNPDDLPFHLYVRLHILGLLAEAAVHGGHQDRLATIVAELERVAVPGRSPAFDHALVYARAVLAPDDTAERRFEDALSADLSAWRFERARLELAYGSWLRRRRRPAESRVRLRSAAAGFDALGVTPWADRARAELAASGETIRRPQDSRDRLTPQELHIAQLAAQGLSNRDIAERLFISPRTVSTHLYRIYPKLDITSRADLPGAVPDAGA